MASSDGEVRVETHGPIMIVTVDREAKRNAFTPSMLRALAEALTRLDDDPALRVGVVTFAGEHSTGGLDLPTFFGPDAPEDALASHGLVDPFSLSGRMSETPIVYAVQGICYTIGIELMLGGDIVVAADDCRFSMLEPKRGLAPLGGATIRFGERGGWGNAMYHLLRADVFDAAEAYRIGLVQEVVPSGEQRDRALELAREIAANAPLGLRAVKRNARAAFREGPDAAAAQFPAIRAELLATEDFQEGIASFIERRDATFEGR